MHQSYDHARSDPDDVQERLRHPLRARLREPAAGGTRIVPPPLPRTAPPPLAGMAAAIAPQTATATAAAMPTRSAPARMHRSRRGLGSALLYGLLGFILGAVFWHFVGFWDFVGHVMFRGKSHAGQVTQAPPAIKMRERAPGAGSLVVSVEPTSCTTLALDRATGETSAAPCATESLVLRSLKVARREDSWVSAGQRVQEVTARGWSSSVTVAPAGEVHAASVD